MGSTVFPAPSAGGKTMFRTTLTSGTSYTVPAGVTYLNVTLIGGGGGGGGGMWNSSYNYNGQAGHGGQVVSSTLSATPGASIAYAIGAGGTGVVSPFYADNATAGGTTSFTGATSALGGNKGNGASTAGSVGTNYLSANNGGNNGGNGGDVAGGAGGAGSIIVEYWA